jgi:hypothetical protein
MIASGSILTSIPDLSLDGLAVDVDTSRSEFDANGRLALQVELVTGESRQH